MTLDPWLPTASFWSFAAERRAKRSRTHYSLSRRAPALSRHDAEWSNQVFPIRPHLLRRANGKKMMGCLALNGFAQGAMGRP